jgi:WD40 repeat protein
MSYDRVTYYNVYLSVSQYGDKYRAELFTEDLGGTEGELLPIDWEGVDEWYPFLLRSAADLPPDGAEKLGERLFGHLLGNPANQAKWAEVIKQVKEYNKRAKPGERQVLRLLVDSSIPDEKTERDNDKIHNLPYGLLRDKDGGYYLFRPPGANQDQPAIQFVRVLRRCTPRPVQLVRTPLRILLAAAEPREPDFHFDCVRFLTQLARTLDDARTSTGARAFDVSVCTRDGVRPLGDLLAALAAGPPGEEFHATFCRTPREGLQSALREGDYDVFHLLAHGSGTKVILCDAAGKRADAVSDELAEWCGANQRLQAAFLQACWASQTQGRGSLGGVAQRLLNPHGGNLAAVIASSYPLDAADSTEAACGFYRTLAGHGASELALDRSLDLTKWSWALLELWVRLSPLGVPKGRASIQYLSPYRGLGSFQERDAPLFFGREAEVAEGLLILEREPVVLLVGSAGSGKSSLLRAGLAHHVRTEGLAGRRDWRVALLRPGYSPLRSLQGVLTPLAPPGLPPAATGDRLADLRTLLARVCGPDRPLLLLCDQFEELFTLCPDEGEHVAVAQALAELADRQPADPPYFRLVLAMRSEFLGAAATLSTALPGTLSLPKRPWLLGPPDARALQAIITRPAEFCGYQFEGPRADDPNPDHHLGLKERIFKEKLLNPRPAAVQEGEPTSPLPLLEFALQQLWLAAVKRDHDTQLFTHADYDSLGGLSGAIGQHAEKVYQELIQTPGLGPDPRELVETLFRRLVGAAGTRKPLPRTELVTRTNDPKAAHGIIDRLVDERLLTIRRNPACPDDRVRALVELTHDVLLESWDRLKKLLTENPRDRELRGRFENDFGSWQRGLPPDLPPRSWRLLPSYHSAVKYLSWLDVTRAHTLTDAQEDFVKALRRKVKLRRVLTVLAVVGLLLIAANTTVFALLALYARAQVEDQLYVTQMHVADEAWQEGDDDQVQDILKTWKASPHRRFEWDYLARVTQRAWSLPGGDRARILDHKNSGVLALEFAGDSQWLVSGTKDGTVRLWNTKTGIAESNLAEPPAGEITGILFSRDRKTVAVWSREGTDTVTTGGHLQLYDAATWKPLAALQGTPEIITWACFSRTDPPQIAVAGTRLDATGKPTSSHVLVWDSAAWRQGRPGVEALPPGKVTEDRPEHWSVVFSPDDQFLLVGGWHEGKDGMAAFPVLRVWERQTKGLRATLTGDRDDLYSPVAVTSADNRQLATLARDNRTGDYSVLLWRWQDDGLRRDKELPQANEVVALDLSPDGTTLAVVGQDRLVTLWDVAKGQACAAFRGHTAVVSGVVFSADGRILASGDAAGKLWLWDAGGKDNLLSVPNSAVLAVAYDPKGRYLALGTGTFPKDAADHFRQGGVQLWDRSDRPPQPLGGEPGQNNPAVYSLAVSREGGLLAWGESSGAIQLWDVKKKSAVALRGHEGIVYSVTFSPDGKLLASGGADGTARLWDVASKAPLRTFDTGPEPIPIMSVSFSPDGKLLAGGRDQTIQVWDVFGRKENSFFSHRGPILAVAFVPHGGQLVAGGGDTLALGDKNGQTLRWWKRKRAGDRGTPSLHGTKVLAVALSPDGTRLASADETGSIKLWDTGTQQELLNLAGQPPGPVFALAFSPDGRELASGNVDGVVRLWRAAGSGTAP